jgi:hypothetical protein
MPRWVATALEILGASGFLYGCYIIIKAYIEVKSAPREPMMMCEKHGPIRAAGTIDFFGTKYCGLCFHDKMKAAERGEIR